MIEIYGSAILREVANEVDLTNIDPIKCEKLAKELLSPNAVGVAGPQIGIPLRMIAVKLRDYGITVMINPRIIQTTTEMQSSNEGCLSIPNISGKVSRNWGIIVEYYDEIGEVRQMILNGLDSACVQHEIDHLNGVLFIDHISGGQKKRIEKKLAKRK